MKHMISIHVTLASDVGIHFDYQYELYSSLQSTIKRFNPAISSRIHENRGVPLFNSSSLLPINFVGKPSWTNARLFALIINTVYPDVLDTMMTALKTGTTLVLNSGMLKVVSVEARENVLDRIPTLPELKCRGPIVIRENGKYFRVGDEGFESHLISALKRKADAITGKDTNVRGIKITSAHRKRYMIRQHGIPASIISFILDADEDVIRTALIYGVGSKTQMGFGMVAVKEE